MISIDNISLMLSKKIIFNKLSWQITPGSRVGLVGSNGTGKTTLFRTIMGEIEPDGGEISLPRNKRIGYLPQDLIEVDGVDLISWLKDRTGISEIESAIARCTADIASLSDDSDRSRSLLERHGRLSSIFEMRGGYAFEAMARKTLKGLGFRDEDMERKCTEFSGGWKMRIALAAALLCSPDILLLDEPTNHLDTESMEWLENWLSSFRGTILAISHDRRFLDRIMTSIAELDRGKITLYKGNFSYYLEESALRREQLIRQKGEQETEIARTKAFIEKFRYKATKAAQVQSRIRMLEKMDTVTIDGPSHHVHIHFPECPRSGQIVVKGRKISKKYDGRTIFSGLDFDIDRGQKVALVGVNGSGKSTLSRLVSGREDPTEGDVSLGHNVNLEFFSQESSHNLNYGNTIWEEICSSSERMTEQEKKNLLGAFLFSGESIHKSIAVLSGGEKSRVALVKILMQNSNFLILDEPTNHLDMATKDLFQRALLEYTGTILIVSHDRYFLDNLVDRVIEIRNGHIYDYRGNYSYFVDKRAQLMAEDISSADQNDEKGQTSRISEKEKKRQEAETRNRIYRQKKVILDEAAPIENRIEKLEEQKAETERRLCDPNVLSNSTRVQELMLELKNCTTELDELMKKWETLMARIEQIEEEE